MAFTSEEWEFYERAKMAEQHARGELAIAHEEGVEVGHKSGKAEAVLVFLVVHGIALGAAMRARFAGYLNSIVLDRWLVRAITAFSAIEVVSS